MLRRMLDPEAGPPDTPPAAAAPEAPPPEAPQPDAPAVASSAPGPYLPFAAYPITMPAPQVPKWTRAYELPSARGVVSSGLQLAVDASRPIRRGSIYIGLLALGAFGPTVVLLLIGIAHLLGEPGMVDTFTNDPSSLFIGHPEIIGPILLIYVLVLIGFLLLTAISVDAQAIAIAILAGRASERPMLLFEAITRARQVFWRLLGAGFLVGIASFVIQLIITLPFLRPNDSNQGLSFIALAIATLTLSPFAFAATGIVLGDVGPIEALQRSIVLFRARKRIALTVTVFTLVTSAIQSFALGAGVDVAVRVGDVMHLNLDLGGFSLVIVAVIVLAVVMAFGSLTFTIAAIVAAPQVTAFLGLTYYAGGLDRARSADRVRPARFRWVSAPMALVMVGLLVIAGVGLPSVAGIRPTSAVGPQPTAVGPLLEFLRSTAAARAQIVTTLGPSTLVRDPAGDGGSSGFGPDILDAEYGILPDVPVWLLSDAFDCALPDVACMIGGSDASAFFDGALVFAQRMAEPPGPPIDVAREWGPVLLIDGAPHGPAPGPDRFPGASHAFLTRFEGVYRSVVEFERFRSGTFYERPTDGRSRWIGSELVTIVPMDELAEWPTMWDAYGHESRPSSDGLQDSLRGTPTGPMLPFADPPTYEFSAGS